MSPATQEADFEATIVDHLTGQGGWQAAAPSAFDPAVVMAKNLYGRLGGGGQPKTD